MLAQGGGKTKTESGQIDSISDVLRVIMILRPWFSVKIGLLSASIESLFFSNGEGQGSGTNKKKSGVVCEENHTRDDLWGRENAMALNERAPRFLSVIEDYVAPSLGSMSGVFPCFWVVFREINEGNHHFS